MWKALSASRRLFLSDGPTMILLAEIPKVLARLVKVGQAVH